MNPYTVLGIEFNATDDMIKAAYRSQASLWHPDKFTDAEEKRFAEQRMREINDAYSQLTDSKKQEVKLFQSVRAAISSGRLAEAAGILRTANDSAEKYFLTGVIAMKKRSFRVAVESIQTSLAIDPENTEYKNTYSALLGNTKLKQSKGR